MTIGASEGRLTATVGPKMSPGDPIEVRETWGTCQPKTTDRIVRVGRIDSVTESSVTVDREVFMLCSDGLYCRNYAGWLRYLTPPSSS